MILYLLFTTLLTSACCYGLFRFFDIKVHNHSLSADDGRGYYLISLITVAFICAALSYYTGEYLGYAETSETSGALVVAIMINMIIALIFLTFGLVKFKPGEKY